MTKTAEHKGFTITATYESSSGTGRTCQSIQGWRIQGVNGWGDRGGMWNSSLKNAKAEIDTWFEKWENGSVIGYSFYQALIEVWGTNDNIEAALKEQKKKSIKSEISNVESKIQQLIYSKSEELFNELIKADPGNKLIAELNNKITTHNNRIVELTLEVK